MNGRAYTCDGCGRKGAVVEYATHYECPVCGFAWEFTDMRAQAIRRTLHRVMPRPRPPAPVRQPPPRLIKGKVGCEKCGRRHPPGWECDARVRWRRLHQWKRFQNSEYVRERLGR